MTSVGSASAADGLAGIDQAAAVLAAGNPVQARLQCRIAMSPTGFPPRVQLRRTAGWRKPDDVVVVARHAHDNGRWGNPFRVGQLATLAGCEVRVPDAVTAVALYRRHLQACPDLVDEIRAELAGRSLACWCPPDVPCHADVQRYVAAGGDPGPLPTITVRPPWSQIIAEAEVLATAGLVPKLCENRGRAINPAVIGRDVGIHAGQTWCAVGEQDPRVCTAWARIAATMPYEPSTPTVDPRLATHRNGSSSMETGAVVAVARLADCHRAQLFDGAVCCAPWGELYHGDRIAQHLVLEQVRRLPGPAGSPAVEGPVRARGYQAVPFVLPPPVDAAVLRQLLRLPAPIPRTARAADRRRSAAYRPTRDVPRLRTRMGESRDVVAQLDRVAPRPVPGVDRRHLEPVDRVSEGLGGL